MVTAFFMVTAWGFVGVSATVAWISISTCDVVAILAKVQGQEPAAVVACNVLRCILDWLVEWLVVGC